MSDFHAAKGNSEQVVELDNRFHEILYNASDSKELKHVLLDFHHYVPVSYTHLDVYKRQDVYLE